MEGGGGARGRALGVGEEPGGWGAEQTYLVSSATSTSVWLGTAMGVCEWPGVASSAPSSPFVDEITCRTHFKKKNWNESRKKKGKALSN